MTLVYVAVGAAEPTGVDQEVSVAKEDRGFASMDRAKQREIASKGGKSVPSEKRSFAQNRDLASEAGRKGGRMSRPGSR